MVCQEPSTEWYCDPKNSFYFFDYFKEIGGNRVKSYVWTERSTEILIFFRKKNCLNGISIFRTKTDTENKSETHIETNTETNTETITDSNTLINNNTETNTEYKNEINTGTDRKPMPKPEISDHYCR